VLNLSNALQVWVYTGTYSPGWIFRRAYRSLWCENFFRQISHLHVLSKWFIFSVSIQTRTKGTDLVKICQTFCTLVWLFSCVSPKMTFKMTCLFGFFEILFTPVGLFPTWWFLSSFLLQAWQVFYSQHIQNNTWEQVYNKLFLWWPGCELY